MSYMAIVGWFLVGAGWSRYDGLEFSVGLVMAIVGSSVVAWRRVR